MKQEAEELLAIHLAELGLEFIREYRFCPERKFRADFYLPEHGVLVECEGSVWTMGRHTRGSGFIQDLYKYNLASMMGFRLLRFHTKDVLEGIAKAFLKTWLVDGNN